MAELAYDLYVVYNLDMVDRHKCGQIFGFCILTFRPEWVVWELEVIFLRKVHSVKLSLAFSPSGCCPCIMVSKQTQFVLRTEHNCSCSFFLSVMKQFSATLKPSMHLFFAFSFSQFSVQLVLVHSFSTLASQPDSITVQLFFHGQKKKKRWSWKKEATQLAEKFWEVFNNHFGIYR